MTEEQDPQQQKLNELYGRLERVAPSQITDARIRQAARQQVQPQRRPLQWTRWASAAAVLVLSVGVVLRVVNEQPMEKQLFDADAISEPASSVMQDEVKVKAPAKEQAPDIAPDIAPDNAQAKAQDKARLPAADAEPQSLTLDEAGQAVSPARQETGQVLMESEAMVVPAPPAMPAREAFSSQQREMLPKSMPAPITAPMATKRSQATVPSPKAIAPKAIQPEVMQPEAIQPEAIKMESIDAMGETTPRPKLPQAGVDGVPASVTTEQLWCGQAQLADENDPRVWRETILQLRQAGALQTVRCLEQVFSKRFKQAVPGSGE